jgi:hypothetical protein
MCRHCVPPRAQTAQKVSKSIFCMQGSRCELHEPVSQLGRDPDYIMGRLQVLRRLRLYCVLLTGNYLSPVGLFVVIWR